MKILTPPKLRQHEWGPDCPFDECRKATDDGKFDINKALEIAMLMTKNYIKDQGIGWSLSSTDTFRDLWTNNNTIKNLSKKEAGILFLAASDIFTSIIFNKETKWNIHQFKNE